MNLERLLKKHKKAQISNRNFIISKILKQWLKQGGNKIHSNLLNLQLIQELSEKNNEWEPIKSELIPFHTWVAKKVLPLRG